MEGMGTWMVEIANRIDHLGGLETVCLGAGPAKSRAAGLMQKLLAFEFHGDAALLELFDRVPEAQTGCRH